MQNNSFNSSLLTNALQANLHCGHKIEEWNPKMAPYILKETQGYHEINLVQSLEFLYKAGEFIRQQSESKAHILFVGTTKSFSESVKKAAERTNSSYINYRWLSGMLTNWGTIQERKKQLIDLELKESYKKTKKWKELELTKFYVGIKKLNRLPDIVILTNQFKESKAISECLALGIPTICLVDTNGNPDLITYPIPGNDESLASIEFILNYLVDCSLKGSSSNEISK